MIMKEGEKAILAIGVALVLGMLFLMYLITYQPVLF